MARSVTAAAVAALFVVLPLGCSNGSDDGTAPENPTSTNAGVDDGSGDDGASVVAPVIIDGAANVTVQLGRSLDVVTENVTRVTSDDAAVLEVSQPGSDGSAQFNAGAVALAAGAATLAVYEGDELLYEVAVTVAP